MAVLGAEMGTERKLHLVLLSAKLLHIVSLRAELIMVVQVTQEVRLRKQGGATVMAVPAQVLKALSVAAEDSVRVTVADGKMIVEAIKAKTPRKRYALMDLLKGATPGVMKAINDDTSWFRDAPAVGREAA
jgi:antitoxin ChpS